MTDERNRLDRRSFMGGAVGAAAGIGAAALMAKSAEAQDVPPGAVAPTSFAGATEDPTRLYRLEADITDCEVTGTIPDDLNGAFYRTGPDPQYPLVPGNIPFDGEGHVSMFRIKNGRASYKSRYARTERYIAQEKAGRLLFPMYRNPAMDDPSVAGLSRSTANTHIINHRNVLLALKEDSPPVAMDLLSLETLDPVYTFDGQLPSKTFTAHPKLDSETGNMVAFGYEANGHGSDDVTFFEFTPGGKLVWQATVQVPYVGMLHDFAVTQRHVILYVIPMAFAQAQMDRGGPHWAWDGSKPTYFGAIRRDGDGSDLQWIEGPTRSATHVMGAWSEGDQVYVDVEMSMSNPFPFMPHMDGTRWDPISGASHITRLSADLSRRRPRNYGIEQLYPHMGALPRQDDRYNTMHYRYGFLPCPDPNAPRGQAGACYARFDHQTGSDMLFNAGTSTTLGECCFAPKNANAGEAVGYLMGVATRNNQGGRADLVILDAEHIDEGPIATVHLPMRAVGQIHGWWVPEAQLPIDVRNS